MGVILIIVVTLVLVLCMVARFRSKLWEIVNTHLQLRMLIERLAMWMLCNIKVRLFTIPVVMDQYLDEILVLCMEERGKEYGSGDLYGDGYFKTRRVLALMLKEHPELRNSKRALIKAVIVCADKVEDHTRAWDVECKL